MDAFLGRRVIVVLKDDEGEYEGTLRNRDAQTSRVTLSNAKCVKTGCNLPGLINFFAHEIENMQVFTKGDGTEEIIKPAADDMGIGHDEKPRPLLGDHKSGHGRTVRAHQNHSIAIEGHEVKDSEKRTSLKLHELAHLPSREEWMKTCRVRVQPPDRFFVIDTIDKVFDEAMFRIHAEAVVGVAFEGVRLSRHGTLSWVQVATTDCVYLFDIVTMKRSCMDEGLGELFESSNILKVINDCRYISDLLFHHYNVSLDNVFDTQAADVLVYKNANGGDLPRYANSLHYCLVTYVYSSNKADAPGAEDVRAYSVRAQFEEQEDEAVWLERPLAGHLLDSAAKRAAYLRVLHEGLKQKLMKDFHIAVSAYVEDLRDRPHLTVEQLPPRHVVPQVFTKLSRQSQELRCQSFSFQQENDRDKHGYRENYVGRYLGAAPFPRSRITERVDGISKPCVNRAVVSQQQQPCQTATLCPPQCCAVQLENKPLRIPASSVLPSPVSILENKSALEAFLAATSHVQDPSLLPRGKKPCAAVHPLDTGALMGQHSRLKHALAVSGLPAPFLATLEDDYSDIPVERTMRTPFLDAELAASVCGRQAATISKMTPGAGRGKRADTIGTPITSSVDGIHLRQSMYHESCDERKTSEDQAIY